jgi:hypothetical protein
LIARAGSYTTKTAFIASPGAKPVETTGTATLKSAAEGRFLMEENNGTLFGQPTNGVRLWGYNNGTKKYEASWVYAGSTAILLLTGTGSDNGTVINWEGSFEDPQGGKVTMRARTRSHDANRFSIELLNKAPDGTEFVMLETTYTRKP